MASTNKLKNAFRGALAVLFLSGAAPLVFAEEVKVIFTGQAYASVYPCACPKASEGGVARRAALIKKVRSASKNVIVVEAGSSLASGPQDQYAKNYEIDLARTEIYLRSLSLMGYDALLVSSQEYAFGLDFLKHHNELPFVSSNIEGFRLPYVIKDLGKVKVGILGFTDALAVSRGAPGWQPPVKVLQERVSELKKKGADLVILLSSLKLQDDIELLKGVKGIDIVINGSPAAGSVKAMNIDGIVFLTTWWQARQAGVLTLDVMGSRVAMKALDAVSLKSDMPDEESIAALLPACLTNEDCKRMPGMIAQCENAATPQARCTYVASPPVKVTVIRPRACRTCHIDEVIASLKNTFGEIRPNDLWEDEPAAADIIKTFKLTMLPAYVFNKDIEETEVFATLAPMFEKKESFYLLKPTYSGVSYLLGRERVMRRLDVVFEFGKSSPELFKLLKAFQEKHRDVDMRLHFLAAREGKDVFIAKGGMAEVEELKRIACIGSLYPGKSLDYLICRSSQADSSWWDECAAGEKMDASRIKECARSQKGADLLSRRIEFTEELEIAATPAFVIDNKEIFGIVNIPSLEELEKTVLGEEKKSEK